MGTAANGSLLIILPLCIGNRNLNKIYSYIKFLYKNVVQVVHGFATKSKRESGDLTG